MVMIYFSGTGNSKFIAEQFARRMQIPAHSIEEELDFDGLLAQEDTVAVCYPIYGSCVPRIMREFVEKHRAGFAGKKLIILCTQMMFSGDGARAFSRLLPACEVRYAEHFSMPNNICNIAVFPMSERERQKKPEKALRRLDQVCEDIRRGIVKKRGWSAFSALLGKTQNVAFPRMESKGKSSFRADESCIACGACVKACPMHNLELVGGRVTQKDNCTLCYRCVNLCPKMSCTVYIHKKPKRQYKGIDPNP